MRRLIVARYEDALACAQARVHEAEATAGTCGRRLVLDDALAALDDCHTLRWLLLLLLLLLLLRAPARAIAAANAAREQMGEYRDRVARKTIECDELRVSEREQYAVASRHLDLICRLRTISPVAACCAC